MKKLELQEIKDVETGILEYIDKICRENNIEYIVYAGTLIGTIRHNGFIPWDDDIDIGLTRKNYNKLFEILKSSDNKDYKIIEHSLNKDYFYPFAKVIDARTKIEEKDFKPIEDLGIYVDIFVFDRVPDDEKLKIKHFKKIRSLQRLIFCNVMTKMKVKNPIKRFLKGIVGIYAKMLGIERILKKYEEVSKEYNDKENCNYCMCNWAQRKMENEIYSVDCVENKLERHAFENIEVNIPVLYDKMLTTVYGDYMKLPPEDQRISHGMLAYWRDE